MWLAPGKCDQEWCLLTSRRARKLLSDVAQVDDNGLDTVTLAFNLGLKTLHLVTVEGVADVLQMVSALCDWWDGKGECTYATDVDRTSSHDCGCWGLLVKIGLGRIWYVGD